MVKSTLLKNTKKHETEKTLKTRDISDKFVRRNLKKNLKITHDSATFVNSAKQAENDPHPPTLALDHVFSLKPENTLLFGGTRGSDYPRFGQKNVFLGPPT